MRTTLAGRRFSFNPIRILESSATQCKSSVEFEMQPERARWGELRLSWPAKIKRRKGHERNVSDSLHFLGRRRLGCDRLRGRAGFSNHHHRAQRDRGKWYPRRGKLHHQLEVAQPGSRRHLSVREGPRGGDDGPREDRKEVRLFRPRYGGLRRNARRFTQTARTSLCRKQQGARPHPRCGRFPPLKTRDDPELAAYAAICSRDRLYLR